MPAGFTLDIHDVKAAHAKSSMQWLAASLHKTVTRIKTDPRLGHTPHKKAVARLKLDASLLPWGVKMR